MRPAVVQSTKLQRLPKAMWNGLPVVSATILHPRSGIQLCFSGPVGQSNNALGQSDIDKKTLPILAKVT